MGPISSKDTALTQFSGLANKSVLQYDVEELIDGVLTKARSSNRHWINIDSLYLNLITLKENIIMLYLFKNCVNGPKKWLVTYLVGNIDWSNGTLLGTLSFIISDFLSLLVIEWNLAFESLRKSKFNGDSTSFVIQQYNKHHSQHWFIKVRSYARDLNIKKCTYISLWYTLSCTNVHFEEFLLKIVHMSFEIVL